MNFLSWIKYLWRNKRVPSVLKLVSRIATRHFNNIWTSMIVICYADKWYVNLFPAEKDPLSNSMNKLFEKGKTKAMVKSKYQSDDEEAGKMLQTWKIKKWSMLPKANPANTSKITYWRICMNTKLCVCFRVWRRQWWSDELKTMEKFMILSNQHF